MISADHLPSVQIPVGVQARPGILKSCHSQAERGGEISLSTTLTRNACPNVDVIASHRPSYRRFFRRASASE